MSSFGDEMEKWAAEVRVDIAKSKAKIAFALFTEIVKRTPVDTGRCRSEWNVTKELPEVIMDVLRDGTKYTSPDMKEARKAIQRYSGQDREFYIVNPMYYTYFLEQGSSPQMDEGFMVQGAINYIMSKYG